MFWHIFVVIVVNICLLKLLLYSLNFLFTYQLAVQSTVSKDYDLAIKLIESEEYKLKARKLLIREKLWGRIKKAFGYDLDFDDAIGP